MRHHRLLALATLLLLADSAAASKNKTKVKEKSFHPVVALAAAEYAGTYVGIDSLYTVEVRVDSAGGLTVIVLDGSTPAALSDVHRNGAQLEGMLPDANGGTSHFTATFVERDLNGARAFGLLVDHPLRLSDDVMLDRLFCKRR